MRQQTWALAFDVPAEEACRRLAVSPRALGEMVRDGLLQAHLPPARFGCSSVFADIVVMGSQVARLTISDEVVPYRERFPLREASTSRAFGLGAVLATLR